MRLIIMGYNGSYSKDSQNMQELREYMNRVKEKDTIIDASLLDDTGKNISASSELIEELFPKIS